MKSLNTKQIKFKILSSCLLIVSIIISLIWALEILLFEPIYKNIQTHQVKKINMQIIENYGTYTLEDYFDISMKNNCNILVFKIEGKDTEVLFNTIRMGNAKETNFAITQLLNNLLDNDSTSYITTNKNFELINVGEVKNIDNEDICFYVNSMLTPVGGVIQVSTLLLLIISIVSFVITVIVSIVLSKRISKPLQQISNQAKELSSGNLEITFNASGYEEVENLSNTLNYLIKEIKKSEKLQNEVIQNVTHELRTPLTIIESYAELIQDFSNDEPQKIENYSKIIIEESKKLENLINDMIDLSKMQSKTLEYTMVDFNLSESLMKFEDFYITKYKDFSLEFIYPEEIIISADKQRIEQVIVNLINNAINYSQEENKKILVSLEKNEELNCYRFLVKDNGIGISKEDINLIFDRHFRSFSAKRAIAGSGVGLTIVKEILEYHKFNYGVESNLNEGSTFFFDIPLNITKVD